MADASSPTPPAPGAPPPANPKNVRTAHALLKFFFRQNPDPRATRRNIRVWLVGAVFAAVLVPLIFYLRFGDVGPLGFGLTVFLVAYCLIAAVALHFLNRPEYHTPVAARGDWLDWIGAFWLMACAFGPLAGWALASLIPLTEENWRGVYYARAGLSAALPVLTALPLLRYVRGQGAPLMLALLVGITALPIWSAWNTFADLRDGPQAGTSSPVAAKVYLLHTERQLKP